MPEESLNFFCSVRLFFVTEILCRLAWLCYLVVAKAAFQKFIQLLTQYTVTILKAGYCIHLGIKGTLLLEILVLNYH